jgi:hypothetical protein
MEWLRFLTDHFDARGSLRTSALYASECRLAAVVDIGHEVQGVTYRTPLSVDPPAIPIPTQEFDPDPHPFEQNGSLRSSRVRRLQFAREQPN